MPNLQRTLGLRFLDSVQRGEESSDSRVTATTVFRVRKKFLQLHFKQSLALWKKMSVGQSATLVQTELAQQSLDDFP